MASNFDALKHLNCQMQSSGVNIVETEAELSIFLKKLPLWRRRTGKDNLANFSLLDECVSGNEDDSVFGGTAIYQGN